MDEVLSLSSERKWAVSCYVPVFNLVICVLASVKMVNSKLCLFHARQGLVLFGFWFFTIIVALFSQELSLMMWGVVLFFHGVGIVVAYKNTMTRIPVLGNLAEKIPEYYLYTLLTGKSPEKPQI